jgi:hypothetical protein
MLHHQDQFPGPVRKLLLTCLAVAAALPVGCGGARRAQERYIPAEDAARRALDTALTAWRDGRPPGLVQDASPAIQLADSQHRPGQKLADFTVLGPTTGDADRCYAVRLTFDNPHEEVRARFVVFGEDPVWVMRYEDYEMVLHWCAPPADAKATPR